MNDQSHMMNPPPPPMMMAQPPPPPMPQVMVSAPQLLNQPTQMMGQNPQLMSQALPQVLTYNHWPQQQQQKKKNNQFHAAQMDHNFGGSKNPKQMQPGRNNNWKGKQKVVNVNDPRMDMRKGQNLMPSSGMMSAGYHPPNLGDLQYQNRVKSRKFYTKRKYGGRFAPYAPRNTTSFIIRAKKSGGIASMVSPCPVTPAVLPTPIFSPSREVLGDMAKEEWGVDGYGSMKGLIRLRNNEVDMNRENEEEEDDNEEEANGSSESDVEEEKNSVLSRLDHEMSRFEMVYPNYGSDHNNLLENRVDDQDTHIAQLEEENLTLRERLFLMESEMEDLRRRLNFLERQNHVDEDANEEVVENGSENESDEGSDVHPSAAGNGGEVVECVRGASCDRDAHGHDDIQERKDEITEGKRVGEASVVCITSGKEILAEEKPMDEERDGASRGVDAERDGSYPEADAQMDGHENQD
ncbi:hypothetical protein MLD38_007353 [Melastoma candidum]|uniref:Uncharacterized protein n=1 Tax=Melastoma candidum TaxID=119954 RepID=A0ACB9RZD1_9MYRT|nr:hypothetical protein MLD38_007353 [Melastoma candidum]